MGGVLRRSRALPLGFLRSFHAGLEEGKTPSHHSQMNSASHGPSARPHNRPVPVAQHPSSDCTHGEASSHASLHAVLQDGRAHPPPSAQGFLSDRPQRGEERGGMMPCSASLNLWSMDGHASQYASRKWSTNYHQPLSAPPGRES